MYLGIVKVKVRAKNRVAFPSRFKKVTGNSLLITNWFENSLMLLPKEKWEELVKSFFEHVSVLQPEVRDLDRFLFGGTYEVELDPEGRFVVPAYLKEYAKIGENVIFVGGMWNIQMWDEKVFENYRAINAVQVREKAIKVFDQRNKKNE